MIWYHPSPLLYDYNRLVGTSLAMTVYGMHIYINQGTASYRVMFETLNAFHATHIVSSFVSSKQTSTFHNPSCPKQTTSSHYYSIWLVVMLCNKVLDSAIGYTIRIHVCIRLLWHPIHPRGSLYERLYIKHNRWCNFFTRYINKSGG